MLQFTTLALRLKPWKPIATVVLAASCGWPGGEPELIESHVLPAGETTVEEAEEYLSARLDYLTALAAYERGPTESTLLEMGATSPDVAALARCEAAGEEYQLSVALVEAAGRMRSEARKLGYAEPRRGELEAAEAAVQKAATALGVAEDELRTAESAIQRRATREASRAEALRRAETNLAVAQGKWEAPQRLHQAQQRHREEELEAAAARLAELEREWSRMRNSSSRSSGAELARIRIAGARARVRQAEESLRSFLRSTPPPTLSETPRDVIAAREEVARLAEGIPEHDADLLALREAVGTARKSLSEKEGTRLEVERAWEAERLQIRERWRGTIEDADDAVRHASYRREVADATLRRSIAEAMEQRKPGGEICSWRLR